MITSPFTVSSPITVAAIASHTKTATDVTVSGVPLLAVANSYASQALLLRNKWLTLTFNNIVLVSKHDQYNQRSLFYLT